MPLQVTGLEPSSRVIVPIVPATPLPATACSPASRRGGFLFDLRAVIGVLAPLGALLPRVEQAVRKGTGITSAELQATLGELPERVNGPMYEMFLVEDWIGGHPELADRLRAGIDVAAIGPGGGQALCILAATHASPAGYDVIRAVSRA